MKKQKIKNYTTENQFYGNVKEISTKKIKTMKNYNYKPKKTIVCCFYLCPMDEGWKKGKLIMKKMVNPVLVSLLLAHTVLFLYI